MAFYAPEEYVPPSYEAVGVRRRFRVRDGSAQGWHTEWIDEYESDEDEPVGAAAAAAAADPPPIPEPAVHPSAIRSPPPERAPAASPEYVVGKIYARESKWGRRGESEYDFHIVTGLTPSGGVRLVPLRKRNIRENIETFPDPHSMPEVRPTDERLVDHAFLVRNTPNMKARIGEPYKSSRTYIEVHSL